MSVTTGFQCVDFRQFYMPHGETQAKPTRKGIGDTSSRRVRYRTFAFAGHFSVVATFLALACIVVEYAFAYVCMHACSSLFSYYYRSLIA